MGAEGGHQGVEQSLLLVSNITIILRLSRSLASTFPVTWTFPNLGTHSGGTRFCLLKRLLFASKSTSQFPLEGSEKWFQV